MRFALPLAVTLTILGCQPPAPTVRQELKTFDRSADAGYIVQMPGTPQSRSANQNWNPTTVYYADNPGVRYEAHSANVVVLGPAFGEPKPQDLAKMLRESRDRFLKEINGTEVYTMDVSLGGKTGIEFGATLQKPANGVIKGRIYYFDWRVYGVLAYGERSEVNGADASKFFDSYQITAKKQGKK